MGVAFGDTPDYPLADFGAGARSMLDEFERVTGRRIELRVEPGGYLVMDSGVLLTTVTDVKPSVGLDDESTPTFVCVDSSYNHVVSAVFHGTYHPIELAHDRNAVPDPANVVTVAGNLMQAGDILARDRAMPPVAIGDVLVVRRCGGYTSSRSSTFNERPRPAEVMVDGGRAFVLRRPETIDDLFVRDV
jgi:diaminopimelate decarboxylase